MTTAGWYNAHGDPAGTQRYWDGQQWVGEPVYEPPQAAPPVTGGYASAASPATVNNFPSSLRTLTIIVSVLKAIPLALATIAAIVLAALSREINDDFADYEGLVFAVLGAALLVLAILILVGGTLVGLQFAGAIMRRPMMLFVPALLMSLFDVLLTIGTWVSWSEARDNFVDGGGSPIGAVVMTAIAGAQIAIAVQAIRARNAVAQL